MGKKLLTLIDVLDNIDIAIHIVDADNTVLYVNSTWEKYYHTDRKDVVGKLLSNLFKVFSDNYGYTTSSSFDASSDSLEKTKETSEIIPFHSGELGSIVETVMHEKTSAHRISVFNNGHRASVTGHPIFDDDGNICYVVTSITDISSMDQLQEKVNEMIRKTALMNEELQMYRKQSSNSDIIIHSTPMQKISKTISYIAPTDATVLITGESGTGKEVIANKIYLESKLSKKPFIKVNCASIPETLIESELFGYEKGAFTGAVKNKPGYFELANNGTLLLDEIGELPLSLQPKLLRVLQEKTIMRVGGTKEIPVNVRLIASTNRNLAHMVRNGTFRSDLFYRLNLVPINIPSLRERREDIFPLVESFLAKYNAKYNRDKVFTENAITELRNYSWPGNIRELQNIVERLVIIGNNTSISSRRVRELLMPSAKDSNVPTISAEASLKQQMEAYEKKILKEAAAKYRSTYEIARALDSSQPTISRKMKNYGIEIKA